MAPGLMSVLGSMKHVLYNFQSEVNVHPLRRATLALSSLRWLALLSGTQYWKHNTWQISAHIKVSLVIC